jgi:uncharacterized Fe-S cluster-containing radical SAM superfamily protein
VRVCIKGVNSEEFTWLTGARIGYKYQLKSLELLRKHKISFNIAIVSLKTNKNELINKLYIMEMDDIMIEEEKIKLYPLVKNRLEKRRILDYFL